MAFDYEFTVRFADVDHAGIVYYPRLLDYFHIAFEEFFAARLGANSYRHILDERRIGFPAVHTECDFVSPLRFSDRARTRLCGAKIGGKSLAIDYLVEKLEGQESRACARGKTICAVVNLESFQAISLPEDLRELFLELSAGLG